MNVDCNKHNIVKYLANNKDKDIFQKDLELEFDLKRSSVSLMLNNMEKHDLIKRVPVAGDARLKKLVLTEKAVEISRKISSAIDSVEGKLLENMEQDEINSLLNMLGKIRSNIE